MSTIQGQSRFQINVSIESIERKEDPDPPRCTLFLEPIRGEEDLEEACRPQQYRHVDPGCLAS